MTLEDTMKKRTIILLILLSTQLYGCSNHTSEKYEIVPFDSETLSTESAVLPVEEKNTNNLETSAEEPHDDNNNTKNTDTPVQDVTTQPKETAAAIDDSYYSAATGLPRTDVERYAAQVKQQFLEHDWSAIALEISYPITISDVTYNDITDFLDASGDFDSNLDEAFFSALEDEDCTEMFCNWEGIMLGETGQVWIGEVLNEDFTSQGLRITAINGMLKK